MATPLTTDQSSFMLADFNRICNNTCIQSASTLKTCSLAMVNFERGIISTEMVDTPKHFIRLPQSIALALKTTTHWHADTYQNLALQVMEYLSSLTDHVQHILRRTVTFVPHNFFDQPFHFFESLKQKHHIHDVIPLLQESGEYHYAISMKDTTSLENFLQDFYNQILVYQGLLAFAEQKNGAFIYSINRTHDFLLFKNMLSINEDFKNFVRLKEAYVPLVSVMESYSKVPRMINIQMLADFNETSKL